MLDVRCTKCLSCEIASTGHLRYDCRRRWQMRGGAVQAGIFLRADLAEKYVEQIFIEGRIEVSNGNIAINSLYTRTIVPTDKQKTLRNKHVHDVPVFA